MSFGSVASSSYSTWSDTTIKCKVPSGLSSSIKVSAITNGGTSNSVTFQVAPWVRKITPASTVGGTAVTITGTGFGNSAGKGESEGDSSSVTFNGTKATSYSKWSDTEIEALVPRSATTGPVVVVVSGAPSNADQTVKVVPSASSFYFAEGYTGNNFEEYLCIGNPNNKAATALVTYIFSDGTSKDASYSIPANTRFTVRVNDAIGPDKEVSIRVLSESANLVAERPMYFNYQGQWTGGHDVVGATSPASAWYFAEGTTLDGFDQYVTVLNPGSAVANLTFHYMVEGAGEVPVRAQVKPNTRARPV